MSITRSDIVYPIYRSATPISYAEPVQSAIKHITCTFTHM